MPDTTEGGEWLIGKRVESLLTGNIGIIYDCYPNDEKYGMRCLKHDSDYHGFMVHIHWATRNQSLAPCCDLIGTGVIKFISLEEWLEKR